MAVVAWLRCGRLFRLRVVPRLFARREAELDANSILLRSIKFSLAITFGFHAAACLWVMLACPHGACHRGSWVQAEIETYGPLTPFARVRQAC